jgi:hypothetical protein
MAMGSFATAVGTSSVATKPNSAIPTATFQKHALIGVTPSKKPTELIQGLAVFRAIEHYCLSIKPIVLSV